MKLAIGSDHGGFELKQVVMELLREEGVDYTDMGPETAESVDYPVYGQKVAEAVASGEYDRGIAICGTGVGISIGLTRLFYVLGEQGMLNPDLPTAAADVLVIPMGEEQQGYAIATATALREAGIRTQLYAEKKKFKARITYAAKMGIPYAMFLGETEEQDKVVALKDLNKGEQVTVSFEEAVKLIQDGIAQANQGTVIKEN